MPWCPSCDRYYAPPAVNADGTCPVCGRAVDAGGAKVATDEEERPPLPWHLKVLLMALAVYLGYRAWQGIEWVWHALA